MTDSAQLSFPVLMCVFKQTLFFKEAITEDGDFYSHPNRLDFCKEIEHLQTRLRETKEQSKFSFISIQNVI